MNVFERFSSEVLPADWSWINEPAEWRFDDSKSLQISAPSQADFFRDPSGVATKSSAPFCIQRFKVILQYGRGSVLI